MAVELPERSAAALAVQLAAASPEHLSTRTVEALHAHYVELRRWSPRQALVGPGTSAEAVARHYGEALAGLVLLPQETGTLVDIGSGAGFPGFVLAAARPQWDITLVEARQKKWAFLEAARRRAALSCRCLNARVEGRLPPGLPDRIDVVTTRALRLGPRAMAALAGRLSERGRFLFWIGREVPPLPAGFSVAATAPLPGTVARRVVAVMRRVTV